jgi:hypothetical protein
MNISFRNLKANEIEIRVERVTKGGAFLLLYKKARVDMNILDETVTPMGWKRSHEVINDNLFCNIAIYDTDIKEWVTKQDVGVESFAQKEKGEASDSFKRAGVCWGIGRELQTAPKIFVQCKTKPKAIGKGYDLEEQYMFEDARVSHIECNADKEITNLAIVDKKGMVIFSNMGKSKKPVDPTEPDDDDIDINAKISLIQKKALTDRLESLKYPEKRICENYGLKSLGDMTIVQLADCNGQLSRIEDKRKKEKGETE